MWVTRVKRVVRSAIFLLLHLSKPWTMDQGWFLVDGSWSVCWRSCLFCATTKKKKSCVAIGGDDQGVSVRAGRFNASSMPFESLLVCITKKTPPSIAWTSPISVTTLSLTHTYSAMHNHNCHSSMQKKANKNSFVYALPWLFALIPLFLHNGQHFLLP